MSTVAACAVVVRPKTSRSAEHIKIDPKEKPVDVSILVHREERVTGAWKPKPST